MSKRKEHILFGYVFPDQPEMKVKEFTHYKAVYCGLCKELGKKYGLTSRFLLNYDLLVLAILADSLSGEEITFKSQACIANPFEKKPMASYTSGISLAADCLVLLSYHKMQDNIADERFAKKTASQAVSMALKGAYKKARSIQPSLEKTICEQMQSQFILEKEACVILDKACDPTAQMVAQMALLCQPNADITHPVYRFGLFLGKLIYLLDAAEDFEKDKKNNSFNIFINLGLNYTQMLEEAKKQAKICAGELSAAYCKLLIKQNKEILDNIVYLGLPKVINQIGCPQKRRTHNEPI